VPNGYARAPARNRADRRLGGGSCRWPSRVTTPRGGSDFDYNRRRFCGLRVQARVPPGAGHAPARSRLTSYTDGAQRVFLWGLGVARTPGPSARNELIRVADEVGRRCFSVLLRRPVVIVACPVRAPARAPLRRRAAGRTSAPVTSVAPTSLAAFSGAPQPGVIRASESSVNGFAPEVAVFDEPYNLALQPSSGAPPAGRARAF